MFNARSDASVAGAIVWRLFGEVDLTSAPSLQGVLECSAVEPLVVLDFTELTFLDAAGVSVLLTGARALAGEGRRLAIVGSPPQVRRVMRLTEVDSLIPLFGSMHDALGWRDVESVERSARKGLGHRRLSRAPLIGAALVAMVGSGAAAALAQ